MIDNSADEIAVVDGGKSFASLGMHDSLNRALADAGYVTATDVQSRAIPPALEGKDLMVSSNTGSGKTASFMLPALQRVINARANNEKRADPAAGRQRGKPMGPRVLVLAPTRELAMQVAKAASTYGRHVQGLRVATVLGGVPYALQLRQLSGPLDILIATPGRLLDHLNSGKCVLENVEMLVLDEADRMLDMGFIDDINTIASHVPQQRQTVMYSATFAGNVGNLARTLLREPQRIEVANHTDTHANIEQRLHWADSPMHKQNLLESLLAERDLDQAVVFTSTQRDADWLADKLREIGHSVAPLHGGMPQGRRNRTLMALRRRELKILVATDVAARGIDVPTITHVINFGLPMKAEDYVHRIGRTGRAGRNGLAVTLAERADAGMIRRIQQFTTQAIPVSQLPGLEPKQPEPRIYMDRPDRGGGFQDRGRGGNKFGGKPFGGPKRFGDRPPFGGDRAPFGGDRPPFNADRGNGGRPFGDRPQGDRPFGGKTFANKFYERDGARQEPRFDNGPNKAFEGKSFGKPAGGFNQGGNGGGNFGGNQNNRSYDNRSGFNKSGPAHAHQAPRFDGNGDRPARGPKPGGFAGGKGGPRAPRSGGFGR